MKKNILLVILLFLYTLIFSQPPANEWQLVKSEGNVSLYYKESTCQNSNVLTIKITNNNDQAVTISWKLWNGATAKTTRLDANQIKEGACNSSPAFMLIDRIPDGRTLSDMEPSITIQIQ